MQPLFCSAKPHFLCLKEVNIATFVHIVFAFSENTFSIIVKFKAQTKRDMEGRRSLTNCFVVLEHFSLKTIWSDGRLLVQTPVESLSKWPGTVNNDNVTHCFTKYFYLFFTMMSMMREYGNTFNA